MTKRTRKPKIETTDGSKVSEIEDLRDHLNPFCDPVKEGEKSAEASTKIFKETLDKLTPKEKKPRKKRQPKSMGTGAMSQETANWLREEEEIYKSRHIPILNEDDVVHTYEDGAKLLTNGAIYVPVKKGPEGPAEIRDPEGTWFGPEPYNSLTEAVEDNFEKDWATENPFDHQEDFEQVPLNRETLKALEEKFPADMGIAPAPEFVTVGDFETPPVEPPKDFFQKEEDFEFAPDYRTGAEIRNEWKRLKEETLQDIVNAMSEELKTLSVYPLYYDLRNKRDWKTFKEAYEIIIRKYRDKILTYQLIYGDEAVSLTLD